MYKYDEKGGRVEVVYETLGAAPTRAVYSYDDAGRIRERLEFKGGDAVPIKRQQDFEFDSSGNWVKSTTLARRKKDGKEYFEPVEVTYRTITYY